MARDITAMTIQNIGNKLTSNGGVAIKEYGVLYSQNESFNTPSTLVVGSELVSDVEKVYVGKFIAPNGTFGSTIQTLDGSVITYFRAYVIDVNGKKAYGAIKTIPAKEIIEDTLGTLPDSGVGVSGGAYYTVDDEGTNVWLGQVPDPDNDVYTPPNPDEYGDG